MVNKLENNDILTTQELSKYLKLNEKTVLKLAQSKKLPGFKIGNQWRFYLSTVDEYLQDNMFKTSSYNLGEILNSADVLPLSRLTDESCINLHLNSNNKEGVLKELAAIACGAGIVKSAQALFEKLLDREKMLSTAMGKGVAIPHPRNPSHELFTHPRIIIGRSAKGVDFFSPDGRKSRIFFMPCATDVVMHLKLLSRLSELLSSNGTLQRFIQAESKREIIKMLLENERVDL